MEIRIRELQKKKADLKKKELDMNSKISAINTKHSEYKNLIETMWKDEEEMLKYEGEQMENYIESMKEIESPPAK